jgi:hypothetical protein
MFEAWILVTSLMGQVCYEPPIVYYDYTCPTVCATTVVGPPIYIEYSLHGMTERSKFWARTPYRDGQYRRVPIINGYAPRVYSKRYSDGSERFLYDYQDRIVYEDIMLADKRKRTSLETPVRPLLPSPVPEPKPDPISNPPKPLPSAPRIITPPAIPRTLPLVPVRPVAPRAPDEPGLRDPSSIPEPRVRISPNYRLGQ